MPWPQIVALGIHSLGANMGFLVQNRAWVWGEQGKEVGGGCFGSRDGRESLCMWPLFAVETIAFKMGRAEKKSTSRTTSQAAAFCREMV